MRVQIPAYTDRWMRGDRYGEVVKITKHRHLDNFKYEIATVKLDKSRGVIRVILDDCTEV
jgi:hypothetical protein